MSYNIEINGQNISLEDIENPFVTINWQNELTVNFDRFTEYEKEQILLFGFPLENNNWLLNYFRFKFGLLLIKDKIKNITGPELINLKYTLNHNVGLCIIHKIIENCNKYKYFIIMPDGHVDGLGMHYLQNFVACFREKEKIFVINFIDQPKIQFEIKDGVRIK